MKSAILRNAVDRLRAIAWAHRNTAWRELMEGMRGGGGRDVVYHLSRSEAFEEAADVFDAAIESMEQG